MTCAPVGRAVLIPVALLLLTRAPMAAAAGSDSARRSVQEHIAEAARVDQPGAAVASPRALLREILSRPEFRDVHGPTWADALKQRVLTWVYGLLRPLSRTSTIPAVGRVVVYASIVVSLLVLILWLRRFLRPRAAAQAIVAGSPPPLSVSWSAWLIEAESAAARGDWREAVHFSYWCGVLFLEAKWGWRPDRSRTPREYLQLLPAANVDRPALATLTRQFEPVWYGAGTAGPQLFADAMASLKQIGCPPARP